MGKTFFLGILLSFGFGIFNVQAQVATTASGGNATGSGGSVSYSVGQLLYTTSAGSSFSVAHGVQQALEVSVLTGNEMAKDVTLEYNVYPNPTTDILYLTADKSVYKELSYYLYSSTGKLLEKKAVTGQKTTVVLKNLPPATYLLKVMENKTTIKTFKIIKK